ncbi:MAG: retroviral-like aspartic protease family protein [Flavobacteriales bacterium]|nr:retroviral-like aspartic protease family protein [Flavobacteriales bacterium]
MLKYLLYLFIILLPSHFSSQNRNFFNTGTVKLGKSVEKLPLHFINDLPFVEVIIGGKAYNFLFDTGAPTIISSAIYKELGLESIFESEVGDSQNKVQKQTFTFVPEISIGNLSFKNVGAIVIDFTQPEFKCLEVDGLIGSNQMALLFWKINYLENSMLVSKDLKLLTNNNDYSTIHLNQTDRKYLL